MLDHEKLAAYRHAIRFFGFALATIGQLPRGNAALADELRRASISIALNIAEGAGRRGEDDRKRFYTTARGSTFECGACLDLVQMIVPAIEIAQGKAILVEIANILSSLTKPSVQEQVEVQVQR
jgi:four helix bundle protein